MLFTGSPSNLFLRFKKKEKFCGIFVPQKLMPQHFMPAKINALKVSKNNQAKYIDSYEYKSTRKCQKINIDSKNISTLSVFLLVRLLSYHQICSTTFYNTMKEVILSTISRFVF